MRVYLDTCSLQRPLDSKTQVRIILEAEAVLGILMLCEAGSIELVSSEVLLFEIRHTPNPVRREYAIQALATSKTTVPLSESLGKRAGVLVGRGFKPLDALHLASAEAAQVQLFCTCDDRLLNKAKHQPDLTIKVVSPVEAIEEINQ